MNNWLLSVPMTSAYDSPTADRDIKLASAVVGGSGHASAVMDARRTMRTCMGEVVKVARSVSKIIDQHHTSCKACMRQLAVAGRASHTSSHQSASRKYVPVVLDAIPRGALAASDPGSGSRPQVSLCGVWMVGALQKGQCSAFEGNPS